MRTSSECLKLFLVINWLLEINQLNRDNVKGGVPAGRGLIDGLICDAFIRGEASPDCSIGRPIQC